MINAEPVIVFSKTYCQFCEEDKSILSNYYIQYYTLELDTSPIGTQIQTALEKISGQSTVPNIYMNKIHIGGCDDLASKIGSGAVKSICEAAGIPNSIGD